MEEGGMSHLQVNTVDGKTSRMGIGPQGEEATVELFLQAMNESLTLRLVNESGHTVVINGAHIVSFAVVEGGVFDEDQT